MSKTEEVFQPQFPALYMCLIIDARHSSRSLIVRDVKASGLFENIFEAKSIADGLKLVTNADLTVLAKQEIDACILGPSLTLEAALTFFKDAVATTVSKDCAFVSVIQQESPGKDELLSAGAHRVIETPCTKKIFSEGIVRAVIAANKNSPWVSIAMRADAEGVSLFGDDSQEPTRATWAPKQPENPVANMLRKVTPAMKRLASQVEGGQLVPNQDGKPSPEAVQAVDQLLSQILTKDGGSEETKQFTLFFREALLAWMLDLRSLTSREASNILHRKLLGWKKGDS